MGYSIGQVAKKTGLTAHTLRYYQKEGLLPFLQKSSSGLRVFSETDLGWLELIECLKETGMPLKDIKQYIDWYLEGDTTLSLRLEMFKKQKLRVEAQIKQFQKHLKKIEYKIALYNEAVKQNSLEKAVSAPKIQELKNQVYKTDKEK